MPLKLTPTLSKAGYTAALNRWADYIETQGTKSSSQIAYATTTADNAAGPGDVGSLAMPSIFSVTGSKPYTADPGGFPIDVTLVDEDASYFFAGPLPQVVPNTPLFNVKGSTTYNGATGTLTYSFSFSSWAQNTMYSVGQLIVDSNNNIQRCTTAGTSKANPHPVWATGLNQTTADNTVVWTNIQYVITTGDLLFVNFNIDPSSNGSITTPVYTVTITDTTSSTWQQVTAGSYFVNSGGRDETIQGWYAIAASNLAYGTNLVLTCTNGGNSFTSPSAQIATFSNVSGFHLSVNQTSSVTPWSSGSLSTSTNELLISITGSSFTNNSGGAPWTALYTGVGSSSGGVAYYVPGTAGSYSDSWSAGANTSNTSTMMSFGPTTVVTDVPAVPTFRVINNIDLLNAVFGGSGSSHQVGAVPDPGAIAGDIRFLREDETWAIAAQPSFTQTWSAAQTFDSGDFVLAGSTSGTLIIKPAATAGTNTLTLPAGTTDFSATGGTSQVVKQTSSGGAFTVAQLAASDLSNGTSGSGAVVLVTSATLVTPTLGAASATSINGLTISSSTGTLTITNGKTIKLDNTLEFAGTDSTKFTFPSATDTVACLNTTQTFIAATQTLGLTSYTAALTSSPSLIFAGSYEATSGPTYAQDAWTIQNIPQSGVNGSDLLTFTHSGTTGNSGISIVANGPTFNIYTGTTSAIIELQTTTATAANFRLEAVSGASNTESFQIYNAANSTSCLTIAGVNNYVGLGNGGYGTSPSCPLDINNGVTDTTAYIVQRLNSGTSGYGTIIQFTDGITYNLGVGTNTSGDFTVYAGRFPARAGTETFRVTQAGAIYTNSTQGVTQTAEAVGTLATTNGIVTTFTAVSDLNLKIHSPYTDGLNIIRSIKPIRYHWTEKGQTYSGQSIDREFIGFGAQNIQPIIPEAVWISKDGYLGFDDRPVVAALVNCVKQLLDRLETLEKGELA